ncbi:hypothetical protein MASR1M74_27230 [Lentimicrobium sp.]
MVSGTLMVKPRYCIAYMPIRDIMILATIIIAVNSPKTIRNGLKPDIPFPAVFSVDIFVIF